jgi:hypothetical protein
VNRYALADTSVSLAVVLCLISTTAHVSYGALSRHTSVSYISPVSKFTSSHFERCQAR